MILSLLVLRSTDPKTLARLYELIGLTFETEKHGDGPVHFSAQMGETVFEIYPVLPDGKTTSGARLGFRVDDVSRAVERIQSEFTIPIKRVASADRGSYVVITDQDGHKIELFDRPGIVS